MQDLKPTLGEETHIKNTSVSDGGLPDDFYVFSVFAFAVPPFAIHDRGVNIGRRKGVGLIQQ